MRERVDLRPSQIHVCMPGIFRGHQKSSMGSDEAPPPPVRTGSTDAGLQGARRILPFYGWLDDLLTLRCEVLVPAAVTVSRSRERCLARSFSPVGMNATGVSPYFPQKTDTGFLFFFKLMPKLPILILNP